MAQCPELQWKLLETEKTSLKLYNSITRKKEVFVPQFGNKVLWYSCGPTVYDASHMGHARSYISFDILRRVLSEYFSYDVFYVMNITDVDDKIIKRARQKYLYEEYVKSQTDLTKVTADVQEAIKNYEYALKAADDKDKQFMMEKIIDTSKQAVTIALSSTNAEHNKSKVISDLVEACADVLCEWQDKINCNKEFDNSIFFSLPAQWETAFYEDMEALNVLPPNKVTRVTEYIPRIVSYVEKIIENGFAYESNGSVYFDTIKFNDTAGHSYGKLVPEAFGDVKKLQEGEGELSITTERLNEKKNPSDFAVWKSSKPGEPSWDSPWGKGRPGWHIECSVMASSILGETMDIHTGGYDLKFPHHDNELAQSEAYFGNDQWVRYFLHSGHLTISGCKMSKSLKNFITIRSALEQHSARQIRLAFLLHSWKDTLNYSPETMEIARHYDKLISEFLLTAEDSIRDIPKTDRNAFQEWSEEELNLCSIFQQRKDDVHKCLCDNIDTRGALENIREVITASNIYISSRKAKQLPCDKTVISDIISYVSKMLKIFGASFGDNSTSSDKEMSRLRALADFREKIRQRGIETKDVPILQLCDSLRDDILPSLGVRLEDQEGSKAVIKLVDPAELAREKEIKQRLEEEKKMEKERKKREQEEKQAVRDALKRKPPSEMFKSMNDKYSKFNEKGIPTHDVEGKELSESQMKKVMKLYTAQEKKYNDYLKSVTTS